MGTHVIADKKGIYLYGNVAIPRHECPDCHEFALVVHGKSACCEVPIITEYRKTYRVCGNSGKRLHLSLEARKTILAAQDNCCFYCASRLGSVRHRRGKPVTLKVNFDHVVPFVYSQDDRVTNFVAACHVCNGIKSAFIYQDLADAKIQLMFRRKEKDYDF